MNEHKALLIFNFIANLTDSIKMEVSNVKLCVKNLPSNTTEQEILDHFSQRERFEIVDVHKPKYIDGCRFVLYKYPGDADDARRLLQDVTFKDRKLYIDFAEEKLRSAANHSYHQRGPTRVSRQTRSRSLSREHTAKHKRRRTHRSTRSKSYSPPRRRKEKK